MPRALAKSSSAGECILCDEHDTKSRHMILLGIEPTEGLYTNLKPVFHSLLLSPLKLPISAKEGTNTKTDGEQAKISLFCRILFSSLFMEGPFQRKS